jgi:hypothetical protein
MTRRRRIFVSVVCLSIAVFSVQALTQATEISEFNNKVVENLKIRWRSIEYEKTLYNPAFTSNKQGQPQAEDLSVSFEIEMPDSGLILSTCPDAVIDQITDSRGSNIESGPLSSRSSFMYVHIPRFIGGFMPAERSGRPELSTLRVGLDAGLLERINGEIGLKGHFYALTAESLEYVELPFEVNDKWVPLTPDVEIRVREARNEASMYQFDIEQRPENVPELVFMRIGDYLPSRLVVDRQIVVQTSAVGSGGGGGEGSIGGKGSGIGRAEKIRYTIAVNPAHQTIPFEIKQVPLSALAGPAPSHTSNSSQPKPVPVRRQMQNITRGSTRSRDQRMPEQVKPQFNKEVADCFEVNWSSIPYSKTLYNPAVSGKSRDQEVSEKLSVRCEARILDPKLIIGTCDIPVIEQIIDGKGRETDISRAQPRSDRMYYSTLQYQPSLIPTLPSSLFYWEGKARLALGLPLRARHLPKRASVLQPVRMGIQLDPGLLRRDTGEIGSIKGYFYALTAESSKHVEVPFKPDDKWVRLTSDVEIQVRKAWHTGTRARFDIGQRGRTGAGTRDLYVGDSLPDAIVVERQFIGKESRPKPPVKFGRSLPGPIGGSGGSDTGRQVEKIDYLIAVDPNHNRIPFEIEHIPLPEP